MRRGLAAALTAGAVVLAGLPASAAADMATPGAAVSISDTGLSPRSVTIVAGGSVTWTNGGNGVHTATSIPGGVITFDTGGLGHGQTFSASFGVPGTFSYTSATDCLNGNSTPGFDCGPYTVTVVVPEQSVGFAPPAENVGVTIDDKSGFQPASLTVQAGQTVVWTNTGKNVHTVTSDGGYFPGMESGGLNPGQTYSYTFPNPGVYAYHSSTEPVYFQDPNSGATNETYAFKGTVTVLSPGGLQPTPTPPPALVAPAPASPPGPFVSKDVTAAPRACGNGNRVPCVASAPNSGTQYIQGHVLDAAGHGIGGLMVQSTNSGGGGIQSSTTDADGLFTIIIANPGISGYCPQFPFPRTYQVWVADASGSVLSDTRTVSYMDCNKAGEFHFDFVKQA